MTRSFHSAVAAALLPSSYTGSHTLEVLGRVIVVLILANPIVIVTCRVVDLCSRRPFHVLSVWFSVVVVE